MQKMQLTRQHVQEEDRGVAEMETPSGKQNMTIINESGLYALIFGSKKEFIIGWKNFKTFGKFAKGYFRRIW